MGGVHRKRHKLQPHEDTWLVGPWPGEGQPSLLVGLRFSFHQQFSNFVASEPL